MIIHLFNSSVVSGPERLVLPALSKFRDRVMIVNLREERIAELHAHDPLAAYCRALSLPYHAISVRRRWDGGAMLELRDFLSQMAPELVHAHCVKASVYLYQARRHPISMAFPIVSTHHGVHGLPDWKTRLYEMFYRRYILRHFDRVLCVSTADYAFLAHSGIGRQRLRLHRNGIDGWRIEPKFRPDEARAVRELWLPDVVVSEDLFLMGVVGRLSAEKDHRRVLKALSYLNKLPCDRDWRCLVFGTGPLEKPLRQRAARLGLDRRVLWMGYRGSVGEELAGLDLLVSLSKHEGMPISLIEAGWAGTPVLCTPVGGVSDLVPDESCGIRIPVEECCKQTAVRLQNCLSIKDRSRLREKGLRFQERITTEFTQSQWVRRLTSIYAELKVALCQPEMPLKSLALRR